MLICKVRLFIYVYKKKKNPNFKFQALMPFLFVLILYSNLPSKIQTNSKLLKP